jgi:hypothetical protein
MPMEVIDLDEGQGSIFVGNGILTSEEYLNTLETHLQQDTEKYKKYKYSIFDLSDVTELVNITTDNVRTASDMCKQSAQINPFMVIAIIADEGEFFGLSRMWEILMSETSWDIMVFKTRDAAETWLTEQVKKQFEIVNPTITNGTSSTAEEQSMSKLGFDEYDVEYHIAKAWNVFIYEFPTRDNLLEIYHHLVKLVSIGSASDSEHAKVRERIKKTTPPSWPHRWTDTWGGELERLGITITLGDVEDARRAVEDLVRDLSQEKYL